MDVASYGELVWDLYEQPGEGSTKADKEAGRMYRRELGGAAANVGSTLARLGIATAVIGAVGDDKLGDALRADLAATGADVAGVARLTGLRTGLVLVARDAGGEPSFTPYRQGTADLALDEAHVGAGAAKVRFAVLGTTSFLPSLRPATTKFLAALDKAKGALVLDLNVRPQLWSTLGETGTEQLRAAAAELASRAAVVKASERDLAALAGKRGMTWLEEHAKGATWVLTRGENGAASVGVHGQAMSPTKRVRCLDASGAGDAFVAGLLAVLVRAGAKPGSAEWKDPKLWQRALELGHLLGAKACSAVGATAGLTSLADVRARLDAPRK
ncbi:MAG: 2-dehydro-3-deoxygluconate kinase [Labilithrix sp.]|nr:2-dehydro-3-deoxygluconate kinase [Labilithrix sp.]